MEQQKSLWSPSEAAIQSAKLTHYMNYLEHSDEQLKFHGSYQALHAWSVENKADFWLSLWHYFEVIGTLGSTVVTHPEKMPGAEWFPDSQLNFAENLLRYRDDKTALSFTNEQGETATISYQTLYLKVAQLASQLKQIGVNAGDRVAGMLPNCIETIIAMLATTSLGAVWSSCSPDFGVQGVVDRFGQIAPKVMFAVDGYYYNGKTLDIHEKVLAIQAQLPSLEKLILIPFFSHEPLATSQASLIATDQAVLWDTFLDKNATEISFVKRSFNDPLYIMFSSGTTGVPKCIVHGIGGTLLQHLKEHVLHTDLDRQDSFFFFTTCGWMMWNWLVSGLATGAKLVLFDGSPFYPNPTRLFDLIDQEKITVFGTSAKFLSALEKTGAQPKHTHDLNTLRTILTTGSVLAPESFDYVYQSIKKDLCLSSISGGTDIISCFALGNPILPVYRGQLQCMGLGLAVNVYDEQGHALLGRKGELVCEASFPCMPTGFWHDPNQTKYKSAYFETFENVWAHGDYAEITQEQGVIIYGRSDTVLNPGGVRIGTAEIYRQVEKVPEVLESIAIGQSWQGDERVVLFVRLREGLTLNEPLINQIKQTIRQHATPRHVPAVIAQVNDIPRTISGKIVELAVKQTVEGKAVKNTDALANPESLAEYQQRDELKN